MGGLHSYQAVLFDLNETILATFAARSQAFMMAALELGFQLSIPRIRGYWGRPLHDFVSGLLPGIDYGRFDAFYRQYTRNYPPQTMEGASTLLPTLVSRGCVLAVVSASPSQLVWQDLASAEVDKYFGAVFGSDSCEFYKPDPRVLGPALAWLSGLGISTYETVSIGDSVDDYLAASGCGIDFIAVTTGLCTQDDFVKAGLRREQMVSSLHELTG